MANDTMEKTPNGTAIAEAEARSLKDLQDRCYEMARSKGFWSQPDAEGNEIPIDRNVGEALMLIVTELGEALEAHRKGAFADLKVFEEMSSNGYTHGAAFECAVKDTFEDEMADVLIRLLDFCGGKGIDLEFFVSNKMKYNATRGMRHGKAY